MRVGPLALATQHRSHYVPHMGIAPTPFDPDAPRGGVQALVRRNPDNMTEIEMVKAVWGSDPRFNDGINYRFVRAEGRAFPARRCLIPASEFRMGPGDHRSAEPTSELPSLM